MRVSLLGDKQLCVIIIGTKGSGKSYAAARLATHGFAVRATSDEIRQALKDRGNDDPSVHELIAEGNRGRAEHNEKGYWILRAAQTLWDAGHRHVAIEGARHPLEVKAIQKNAPVGSVVLLGIDGPIMQRYARFCARARSGDPRTLEDFVILDDRDRGKGDPQEPWDGQQVDRTLACVDSEWCYYNDRSLIAFDAWIDVAVERMVTNFV